MQVVDPNELSVGFFNAQSIHFNTLGASQAQVSFMKVSHVVHFDLFIAFFN